MENNALSKNVFVQYRDAIVEINEHYDDCSYKNRLIPIDVCPCDCYSRQIFELGRTAERDLLYS